MSCRGGTNTGGFDKYSLISSKACCCSASQRNSSSDLIFTKPINGSMRPDRLEINRLTKLILPMSFCNSFFVVGGFIIFTASAVFLLYRRIRIRVCRHLKNRPRMRANIHYPQCQQQTQGNDKKDYLANRTGWPLLYFYYF